MTYQEITGNIFNSNAQAIVNTVNCVGAMGKGIALEFRRRFPEMFLQYQKDCKESKLRPGNIYPYKQENLLILNFAIKDHWKFPSKIEWIDSCLQQFLKQYQDLGINSVAFPWMGAMNGGIPISKIQWITRKYLRDIEHPDLNVEVYTFDPDADDPLFCLLRNIVKSDGPESKLSTSGLATRSILAVIDVIRGGKVKSLAQLVDSRVIGDTSIDKLYIFLSSTNSQANKEAINVTKQDIPTQPRLF
jgi:O-acetyl-ADP-ribose deacetylase (regulator of RNase III)